MKSLDELDHLGHVVDDGKLEEVTGGSNWRNAKWFKSLMKDITIASNALESAYGAAAGYGRYR